MISTIHDFENRSTTANNKPLEIVLTRGFGYGFWLITCRVSFEYFLTLTRILWIMGRTGYKLVGLLNNPFHHWLMNFLSLKLKAEFANSYQYILSNIHMVCVWRLYSFGKSHDLQFSIYWIRSYIENGLRKRFMPLLVLHVLATGNCTSWAHVLEVDEQCMWVTSI